MITNKRLFASLIVAVAITVVFAITLVMGSSSQSPEIQDAVSTKLTTKSPNTSKSNPFSTAVEVSESQPATTQKHESNEDLMPTEENSKVPDTEPMTRFYNPSDEVYALAQPQESMELGREFRFMLRCRNMIKHEMERLDTEDLRSLQSAIEVKQAKTNREKYFNLCVEKGLPLASFADISKADDAIFDYVLEGANLGNEYITFAWSSMYIKGDSNQYYTYESSQKQFSIDTLKTLMSKGHAQSAAHLVSLYTDPDKIYDYNEEEARKILRDFYKLSGEKLDNTLNYHVSRVRHHP